MFNEYEKYKKIHLNLSTQMKIIINQTSKKKVSSEFVMINNVYVSSKLEKRSIFILRKDIFEKMLPICDLVGLWSFLRKLFLQPHLFPISDKILSPIKVGPNQRISVIYWMAAS